VEEGQRQPTHSVHVSSGQERAKQKQVLVNSGQEWAKQKHVGHTATKGRRLTVRRRGVLGRLLPSLSAHQVVGGPSAPGFVLSFLGSNSNAGAEGREKARPRAATSSLAPILLRHLLVFRIHFTRTVPSNEWRELCSSANRCPYLLYAPVHSVLTRRATGPNTATINTIFVGPLQPVCSHWSHV